MGGLAERTGTHLPSVLIVKEESLRRDWWRRSLPRPTLAGVVALLALCVALGNTSLAAPLTSSGASVARQLARALTLSRHASATSKRALSMARQADATAVKALHSSGSAGPTGPPGPAGSPGRPGANGTAIGYATVEWCAGGCPDQPSAGWYTPDEGALGVDNTANFRHAATGVFCLHDLPFHVHNLVANLGPSTDTPTAHNNYLVQTQIGTGGTSCPTGGSADQNVVVEVRDQTGTLTDPDASAKILALLN